MLPESTIVTWLSKSRGVATQKTGEILEYIPPYQTPKTDLFAVPRSRLKFEPIVCAIAPRWVG